MRVSIKKWGNSASVQIPTVIMRAAHLELNQIVDVREENGCIIIEPVQQPEFDVASLVAGITSQNLHKEADFGVPIGKEVR
jgi:antitoxin MazE